MIIIGITGTIGAGKGTIVEYLTSQKQFVHYSVRSFLLKEIHKRGMETNRDSMVLIANELRQKYSSSYIIDELMKEAVAEGKNGVIESIRNEGEIISLRHHPHFYLLSVDAQPEIRYQRIQLRASETDHIDYQTFLANEKRELHSNDPTKQNLSRSIELADYKLINNTTREDLYLQIEGILKKIPI